MDSNTYAAAGCRQKPYKILTEADIQQLLNDDISTISAALSFSRGAACTLLCRNNWNLAACTLLCRKNWNLTAANQNPQSHRELGQRFCKICYDELRYKETSSAACGHRFCNHCWKTYLAKAIADGPGCLTLTCPEPGCSAAAGLDLVESVALPSDMNKYHRYLRRSYVECSRSKKWCPAAGCDLAVEFHGGAADYYDVTCRCSRRFCWNCRAAPHRPARCKTAATADAESERWIAANTKPCPKCRRRIEKNEGCNFMRCIKPCHFSFCWQCAEPLAAYGANCRCNSYRNVERERANDRLARNVERERTNDVANRLARNVERERANDVANRLSEKDVEMALLCIPCCFLLYLLVALFYAWCTGELFPKKV